MIFRLFFLLLLAPVCQADSPDWKAYNEILIEYVSPGEKNGISVNLVNYTALQGSSDFMDLVAQIREFDVSHLETREEHLAFYINAYNILTIQLIIDHWPVNSIRDVGNLFRGPWDQTVLTTHSKDLTLDNIEHDIIRSYGEPLIHFAVNCASVSCPDLRREAYQADRLNEQLTDQIQTMFQQQRKGAVQKGSILSVTKLFKWYASDFEANGSVESYIRAHFPNLEFSNMKADLDYDWSLNGVTP
jgi:hypothetical protein